MGVFKLELAESEVKIILESLTEMGGRMANICDTSDDEDEIADVGNDLIELRLLFSRLKERAVEQYGKEVMNFSRESL